jgi:hypothetical protein
VAWFARVLVPELRDAGTREAVAGGWAVGGEARVSAVEDRLTVLESSAPDPADGDRARALRDAVRSSRARLQTMVETGTEETIRRDLDQVAVELEAVLPPAEPQPRV